MHVCLVSAFACYYHIDCFDQNPNINKEIMIPYIFFIQINLLFKRNIASARNLPNAGESGFNMKTFTVFKGILLNFSRKWRTRTNQTHVPFKYINQLGQFIN